jgi:OTT_1508-like deaminase
MTVFLDSAKKNKKNDSAKKKIKVRLVISGNQDIPIPTKEHLSYIWKTLAELSDIHAGLPNSVPNHATSRSKKPHLSELLGEAKDLEDKLWSKILQFSWEKVCRRIEKGFDKFMCMDIGPLASDDPLREVGTFLRLLEKVTHKAKINIVWGDVQKAFHYIRLAVGQFQEKMKLWPLYEKVIRTFGGSEIGANESRLDRPDRLDRYLLNLVAVPNDIEVLLALARSPRCRRILRGSFEIRALPTDGPKSNPMTDSIPQKRDEWQTLMDSVLEDRNKYKADSDDTLESLQSIVFDHCHKMEERGLEVTNLVHCECKLALYFLKQHRNQPRPYSYIGVSKLSCRGCNIFLSAVNKVFGSNFLTKGCHHKWYYPWRFPPLTERRARVAQEMYKQLCMTFSRTYGGFCVKRKRILSDSKAGSGFEPGELNEPEDKMALIRQRLKSNESDVKEKMAERKTSCSTPRSLRQSKYR